MSSNMSAVEEDDDASDSPCLPITIPLEPGTIDTCSCFTLLDWFDAGLYLCEDIAEDVKIIILDLLSWNS